MNRRTRLVYGVLLAVWAGIVVWQVVEHNRVGRSARQELINRAKYISTTVGLMLRAQSRYSVIPQDWLESALNALIKPEELYAVALLNAEGEVVASAGASIDFELADLVPTGEYWGDRNVTLMNLVDLGTNVTAKAEKPTPTIVLSRDDLSRPPGTDKPAPPPSDRSRVDGVTSSNSVANSIARPPGRGGRRGGGDGRPPFGRPFWMSKEEYESAIQKKSVHSFAIKLSTQSMRAAISQDLWLRSVISVLAAVSVVGLGLAWRTVTRSSELELRLVRAAELNTRLKEMNFAAAGLAHETRNPLNIIRGLAQMISKQPDSSAEVRQKSREIVDETDRVTAQLNEFIDFSRPREVRRSAVALSSTVGEVVRALESDLEEKAIHLEVAPGLPTIEADEQLLRQALFNLLLNAVQAADRNGEIRVVAVRNGGNEARLEIRDNGPGVPPDQRTEVFKPYFTTHPKGTGLGLAVVQQIVLAHGWEIACLPNEPRGAIFQIAHLKLSA